MLFATGACARADLGRLESPLFNLSFTLFFRRRQVMANPATMSENGKTRCCEAVTKAESGTAKAESGTGGPKSGKRDRSDIVKLGSPTDVRAIFTRARHFEADGKRDRSDIVKLGSPTDVRAIFTRARHFDFGPPFAGDPWDERPTLGPNVSRFPSAIPAGQRGGLVARCGAALPVPARRRFD